MSYDLLNLGGKELMYGTGFLSGDKFLCNQDNLFNLPTVSANLVFEDTGGHVTESSTIKEFARFKVGLTGIVSKEYEQSILESNRINSREIVVLDEGRIVEEGNHRTLLARHGLYASLYSQSLSAELGKLSDSEGSKNVGG